MWKRTSKELKKDYSDLDYPAIEVLLYNKRQHKHPYRGDYPHD